MNEERKTVALYSRGSSNYKQDATQLDKLSQFAAKSGWEVYKKYKDAKYIDDKPGFLSMMRAAKNKAFDILLIWKIECLCPSLKELTDTINKLESYGVDLVSYNDKLDTVTGKIVAFSEFKKTISREKSALGGEKAKKSTKRLGRPPIIPTEKLKRIRELRKDGLSFQAISKAVEINESTVRKRIRKLERKNKLDFKTSP